MPVGRRAREHCCVAVHACLPCSERHVGPTEWCPALTCAHLPLPPAARMQVRQQEEAARRELSALKEQEAEGVDVPALIRERQECRRVRQGCRDPCWGCMHGLAGSGHLAAWVPAAVCALCSWQPQVAAVPAPVCMPGCISWHCCLVALAGVAVVWHTVCCQLLSLAGCMLKRCQLPSAACSACLPPSPPLPSLACCLLPAGCREICRAAYAKIKELRRELDGMWGAFKQQRELWQVRQQLGQQRAPREWSTMLGGGAGGLFSFAGPGDRGVRPRLGTA